MPDQYPAGAVLGLIDTDNVEVQTRVALQERLVTPTGPLCFFDDKQFEILSAACARLIPQGDDAVDLAALLDRSMASGLGNGWRYADMPPDDVAIRRGLAAIEASARAVEGKAFSAIGPAAQDALLARIGAGDIDGPAWHGLPPARFLEELVASLAVLYFSHPVAKDRIGDASFASAKGWTQVGLNRVDAIEPRRIVTNMGTVPDA